MNINSFKETHSGSTSQETETHQHSGVKALCDRLPQEEMHFHFKSNVFITSSCFYSEMKFDFTVNCGCVVWSVSFCARFCFLWGGFMNGITDSLAKYSHMGLFFLLAWFRRSDEVLPL